MKWQEEEKVNLEVEKIAIVGSNKQLIEKMGKSVKNQYSYFKNEIIMINSIRALERIIEKEEVNIVFVILDKIIDKEIEESNIMESDIEQIVFINTKNVSITKRDYTKYNNIVIYTYKTDYKIIAFQILYKFYKNRIKYKKCEIERKKIQRLIKRTENNKINKFLSNEIDEIFNKQNCRSVGYRNLKKIITICIINELKVENEEEFYLIYKIMLEVYKQEWEEIKQSICKNISIIRGNTKGFMIQKTLVEIKGKSVVEQIISISNEISKECKYKWR